MAILFFILLAKNEVDYKLTCFTSSTRGPIKRIGGIYFIIFSIEIFSFSEMDHSESFPGTVVISLPKCVYMWARLSSQAQSSSSLWANGSWNGRRSYLRSLGTVVSCRSTSWNVQCSRALSKVHHGMTIVPSYLHRYRPRGLGRSE
ncbi:hypothetical protein NPIL_602361 [Nephila pilipes]|uniref:Uncharacterized protein n=1 Tax=Nephila pilipes TaxID=299642 RepID=A0A8X6U441_NEPPI|nr:hypothetical protein NPIL_602361 [Nephila pilipes]